MERSTKTGRKKNVKSHLEKKSGGQARHKQKKQEEAILRQALWDKKTTKEKIEIVKSRGGSVKELKKLGVIK